MPYLTIKDYRHGMDRRRERVAGVPGTLWTGKNVHITRGGDVERRLPFRPLYEIPGTFGAAVVREQIYVFGSADLASSMPVNVQYQRLVAPSSPAMTALLDVKTFNGKFYAIAEYENGNVYHFYNGTRVSDWDTIAAANATLETTAKVLADKIETNANVTAKNFGATITVSALQAGTAFTISKSTTNVGTNDQDITLTAVQANVAAVTEVLASATVTVTGGSSGADNAIRSVLIDNSVELLDTYVLWTGSDAATAIRLASEINKGFATHGYSAVSNDETVTITASPGTGTTPNGLEVFVTSYGNVETTFDTSFAGGVAAVEAVKQVHTAKLIGTLDAGDTFSITINGIEYKTTVLASGTGRTALVTKQRVWSPISSVWQYCKLSDAADWIDATAGFINVATETEGNEDLVVGVRYQELTAVLSSNNILVYQLDVDPANNALDRTLENTGTDSPHATLRYGNNDVFYLDSTGIRSLRARDTTDAPFVYDIGSAIDTFVREYLATLTRRQIIEARSAIEPRDGRYMLIVGTYAIVLSQFAGAKISAWTYYDLAELEGDQVTAAVRLEKQLLLRAGDFIYAYGDADGVSLPEADEVIAEVDHPFMSGETPGTIKNMTGFDIACRNTWAGEVACDPNDPTKTINVGNLSRITFADDQQIALPGHTSMFAPKLTCSKGGAATLSMLAIHYQKDEAN